MQPTWSPLRAVRASKMLRAYAEAITVRDSAHGTETRTRSNG